MAQASWYYLTYATGGSDEALGTLDQFIEATAQWHAERETSPAHPTAIYRYDYTGENDDETETQLSADELADFCKKLDAAQETADEDYAEAMAQPTDREEHGTYWGQP